VALAVVFVLVVGLLFLSIPRGLVTTAEDGTPIAEIAMLSVPIAAEGPVLEDPDQYLGMPHPEPAFDTGELGRDFTFHQEISELQPLDEDRVLQAVYLGHDVEGDPYYVWRSGSPDLRRMVGQVIADFGAVGRFETSYGTEEVGQAFWEDSQDEDIAERGLTTGSLLASSEGTTLTAEWHGLPREVSVVVIYQDGLPVGWQRVISGTAAFQLHYPVGQGDGLEGEMVALTATGDTWNRHVLFPG
jgi:hypothetical protein